MAQIVRRQQTKAFVGYFSFGLQDSDDASLPVPFPDDFATDTFLGVHPGRLDVTSGGHTHTALLDVEVWDAVPPPQKAADWDEVAEADFESISGTMAVWSMHTGRMDGDIKLGEAGGCWRVRACCSGRAEAAALSEAEGAATGAERYLLQFWPSSTTT
ncbi:hypothetical protein ACGFS9_31895 [Streptomyces sp. NPDC048566]|uniref:hypothetical protein n=1 Tax=Streptomyces sp. NPDC048566 TaxID=3365569 RepID=UPI003719FDE3